MAKAGIVYVGTDDGVVILSDPASIGRWRRIGHELAGQAVRTLVSHSALMVDLAVAGAGVQHSDDGGQSWQQTSAADAIALASHPDAPATLVLASSAGELQRSDDGGANWRMLAWGDLPSSAVVQLILDPHVPGRLLVALSDGVWSNDDDAPWQAIGAGSLVQLQNPVASPGRAGMLVALADAGIWTTATPEQWTHVAGAPSAPFSGALAVLPGKTEVVLAATLDSQGAPGLVRSDDDGRTWQVATTEPALTAPITVIVPAAYHIDTAWAGTSDGQLLLSDDRGRSWHVIARDLAPIRTLAAVRLA